MSGTDIHHLPYLVQIQGSLFDDLSQSKGYVGLTKKLACTGSMELTGILKEDF